MPAFQLLTILSRKDSVSLCSVAQSCLTLGNPTPWTVACQAPLSMGLSWDYPSKIIGVDCHFLLKGIFPTQGFNPCLLHWQVDSSLVAPPLKLMRNIQCFKRKTLKLDTFIPVYSHRFFPFLYRQFIVVNF